MKPKAPNGETPNKEKKKKSKSSSLEFNPLESAIFDLQRREVTGNVIYGGAFILLGVITIIVSVAKCYSGLDDPSVDDDKILAYAWITYAVTGLLIAIIGVYEILKSFISMEQIKHWTKTAHSHASPFQEKQEKRSVAEMNQSQSTESAPAEGMAEDGSRAKKHFLYLGKEEKPKPDRSGLYEKYNPPAKAPANAPEPPRPPKPAPGLNPKLNYGINEEKKKTFADKFLEENKRDSFAGDREDRDSEQEDIGFYEPKPQFMGNEDDGARPSDVNMNERADNAPDPASDNGMYNEPAPRFSEDRSPSNSYDDDDGFFMGTNAARADNRQPAPEQSEPVREMPPQPQAKAPQSVPQEEPKPSAAPSNDNLHSENNQQQSGAQLPPDMPPMMQGQQGMPMAQGGGMLPPMMPNQPLYPMNGYMQPNYYRPAPVQNMYQPLPNLQGAPGMAPNQGGFVSPFGYAGSFVSQNDGTYNPAMPPYTVHPFRPAAAPPVTQSQAYNSAMPPYTVHVFKSASSDIAAPQMAQGGVTPPPIPADGAEGSYNSAMPPYTVHPFKAASAGIAAPQMAQGGATPPPIPEKGTESSYNSAMPPYTVHGFKAKNPEQQPIQPQLFDQSGNEDLISFLPPEQSEKVSEKAAEKANAPVNNAPVGKGSSDLDSFLPPEPKKAPAQQAEPQQQRFSEPPQQNPPAQQKSSNAPRAPFTRRSEGNGTGKKPPITQRLGEYTFSLFEELSRGEAPKSRRSEVKKKQNPNEKSNTTGGNSMAFGNRGREQAPEKKSFSDRFLSRNGNKSTKSSNGNDSGIVKGGTPAQRKYVDASEYDEWECPGCGKKNQEYVGVCACGERKPRVKW